MGDDRAVEPLILALKDDDGHVREETVAALREVVILGKIGDERGVKERVVEAFIQALKDDDGYVRQEAAEFLERVAGKSILDAEEFKGAGSLGEMVNKRAVEPLIQALKDDDRLVRSKAADALGMIGDRRAVDHLIKALKDEDNYVRRKASEVLDKLGWKPGNDIEKANYLIAKKQWDELVKVGKPAVEPLTRALEDKKKDVREAAVEALGKIKDKRAVKSLTQALMDEDEDVRKVVTKTLEERGESWLEPLVQALMDEDEDARQEAAKTLGKIGDTRAADAIINWLFMNPLKKRRWRYTQHTYGSSNTQSGTEEDPQIFWKKALKNLLGDYTDLVLKAFKYTEFEDTSVGITHESHDSYEYNLSESDKAIRKLCEISTQISTNILHKISQKRDIEVEVSYDSSCSQSSYDTLSFESQRKVAKKELERRGNPPYDPSAYLKKENWKL